MDEKLRAALQEMDDIMKVSFDGSEQDEECYTRVKGHTDDLLKQLKSCNNAQRALERLPAPTILYLKSWLLPGQRNSSSVHGSNGEMNLVYGGQYSDETGYASSNHSSSSSADMKQLESDNDNLKRQIWSLQSQIQDNKGQLKVIETRLANSNEKLMKAEDRLHKEQVNKTYMESHKLDLMAEVAELRLRLQTTDGERIQYKDRYEGLQNQIQELHEKLLQREREISELRTQLNRNGYQHMNGGSHHPSADALSDAEVQKLKKMVNELLTAGHEKDRKITELRKAVSTYQRVEEIILQSQGRPRSSGSESCGSSNDRVIKEATERPPGGIVERQMNSGKPNGQPAMTSTPVSGGQSKYPGTEISAITSTPTPSNSTVKRSNSYDAGRFHKVIIEDKPLARTPGTIRKVSANRTVIADAPEACNGNAEAEASTDEDDAHKEDHKKKKAGIRKFFAKLKRSSSQEALDEMAGTNNAFKRGGTRATAGPRLGWGSHSRSTGQRTQGVEEPRTPFHQWDCEEVARWLNNMGLSLYSAECRRWNRTGKQLLEANHQEVDKELRIHNPLHRKKLHLALEAERSGSRKDKLLYNLQTDWVSKWLDDIGLPQYKDQFFQARVDSRMLNYITVEDLLYMKITNAIHHSSIRRGIEVLRKQNFNLSALKRRPVAGSTSSDTQTNSASVEDVMLWTNHRVMEWLRSVDLSEYAANLRGSGVHGALIVLEPKFTVEHLASILNIPASKTLLRRHLTAHFINLITKELQDQKTEAEHGLRLELNTKIKPKKNIFKKGRIPTTDYLCPLDLEPIDARAEDKRIKEAVAMYKQELNKTEKPDRQV
ncbi:liprin-beta-2-like isoform X2 [Watersipora subatra]|uniref:liprin-beta-2-like isoform X2 n=1 Tax=Watersipora subatra TaxID=2589382 RepID=UPI00355B5A16